MLATRAADNGAIVAYVNMVGGQDELVFDGSSLVFDPDGELVCQGRAFEEDLLLVDLDVAGVFRERLRDPRRRKSHLRHEADRPAQVIEIAAERRSASARPPLPPREPARDLGSIEEIYRALVLGTRDYVCKTGFRQVVLGVSGGIDSSLVAAIAADALGPENVLGDQHALEVLESGQQGRRRRSRTRAGHALRGHSDRVALRRDAGDHAGHLQRDAAQRSRGEPAGAHPWPDLDGGVEQVRLHGADDGQQERDGVRVRDAVRRYGRRLRGHQGRAEDQGVRAVALSKLHQPGHFRERR